MVRFLLRQRDRVRSSVYSRYVIRLISWADTRCSPMSSLSCDRQRIVKFRGALRFVIGTCAPCLVAVIASGSWRLLSRSRCRRKDGMTGHAVDIGLPYRPTLPYIGQKNHAQLTVLKVPVNQFCSGRTVGRASIISSALGPRFLPSLCI